MKLDHERVAPDFYGRLNVTDGLSSVLVQHSGETLRVERGGKQYGSSQLAT
jgi:hypothetical protein